MKASFPVSVVAQGCLVGAVLALLSLAPALSADVLAIPLTAAARGSVARIAIAHGATLLAGGPFPGSIVVRPGGTDLYAALLRAGAVPVIAPFAGCGTR